jgi:hypothetical protein
LPHGYTGLAITSNTDDSTVTGITLDVLYESTDGGGYSSPTAPTDAGTYMLTLSVPASNLDYTGHEVFNFTISKATVVIKANNATVTTGQAAPAFDFTTIDLVYGDTLAALPVFTTTYTTSSPAGTYDIVPSGAAVPNTSNYNAAITYVNGTLTASELYTGGGSGSGTTTPPNTPETGDNTVTTPTGQPPVTDSNGNTTLPGGGTVQTPGGSIIDVPTGTTIDKDGNITIPSGANADVTLPGGQEITLPGGSTIDSTGKITTGSDTQVSLPGNKTLDVPGGSTISNNGTLTVGAGGATFSYGGMSMNIAAGLEIIFDEDVPLGYFISASNPFTDVDSSAWFYDSVMFAYTHGLMVGTSTDPMAFSPDMTATRGMIVTILYRMAGSPDVSGQLTVDSGQFWDVEADKW